MVCGEDLFHSLEDVYRYKFDVNIPMARLSSFRVSDSLLELVESLLQGNPQNYRYPTAAKALTCRWIATLPLAVEYKLSARQRELLRPEGSPNFEARSTVAEFGSERELPNTVARSTEAHLGSEREFPNTVARSTEAEFGLEREFV